MWLLKHEVFLIGCLCLFSGLVVAGESESDSRPPEAALIELEKAHKLSSEDNGAAHPQTLALSERLAVAYIRGGSTEKAVPLLAELSAAKPENLFFAMKVAALQVWFGHEEGYQNTRKRMVKWFADTETWPSDLEHSRAADCLAKIINIHAENEDLMRDLSIELAQLAIDKSGGRPLFLEWYQMDLGVAELRAANHEKAEAMLSTALASPVAEKIPQMVVTANFYRAINLFKEGKKEEAKALYEATQSRVKPPADLSNPLIGNPSHDDLILWLALNEAKGLIESE